LSSCHDFPVDDDLVGVGQECSEDSVEQPPLRARMDALNATIACSTDRRSSGR